MSSPSRRDLFRLGMAVAPVLPPRPLLSSDPEKYWNRLRAEQFLLPESRVFLNNGSLGVAPKPVVDTVTGYLTQAAGLLVDGYPRWGYETLDEHRAAYASFLGCRKDELAFMHNATEAMSTIAAGLDLKPGDEVLTTDQEHPSGRSCWLEKQKRSGIQVREVALPLPPKSHEQLADLLISAIGPRTKVLSFSGITTTTGLAMPMREICAAARAKNVITVVDGAHVHGQIPANLNSIGCDFFAGSPHKWMFAPAGCGLLYIREEMLDRLWPNTVTGHWDDLSLKAARFMMVGTNNRAIFEGMMAGLAFHRQIGSEAIFERIHSLARYVRKRASEVPYLRLLTPEHDSMYGSLVTFEIAGKDPAPLVKLTSERKIWISGANRIRISTHVHTRKSDIDAFFAAMSDSLGRV